MNNKQDIAPRNDKNELHGSHEVYWGNGNLDYKGNWINGKEHGYWEGYWDSGIVCFKCVYNNGKSINYSEWTNINNTDGSVDKKEFFLI